MSAHSIELISFNLCPFVQRSVITLLKKGIDFDITYINLADPPKWFLDISPLGKVPLVRFGSDVLFESAAINEFVDEITPNPIMRSEPLHKAMDRAWIEFSSQVISDQYLMTIAQDNDAFEKHSEALANNLQRLEDKIEDSGFFNKDTFSLVDTALAPIFTRFDIISRQFDRDFLSAYPKLIGLSQRLLALEAVQNSVIDDFENIFVNYLKANNSYLAA